jgi:acetyl esterase/lipase
MGIRRVRRTTALALALVGALVLAATACEPTDPTPTTTTTTTTRPPTCTATGLPTTVAYRTIPGVAADLTSLDLHVPAGTTCRKPVVLWVHGGGYQSGDKANGMAAKKALLNSRGWILVSVNYRLTTPGSATSARFPDHYDDVASAVAWVHGNIARYGGDPGRIALLGHSAGADIVSNVAAQPSYLASKGLPLSVLDCVGPLDTEGFDKVASGTTGEDVQWKVALGNNPNYLTETSANLLITPASDHPPAIGVYRGTALRQAIEKAYVAEVAATGAATVLIDARSLSHAEVNQRIGAAGDAVMTPPLLAFLTTCLR